MGRHFLLLVLAIVLGQVALAQEPQRLRSGRYSGYVHLPSAGMKLATVLDTVYIPETIDEKSKLAAYLKVSFGGFHSHEYLTHYFLVPDYDWNASDMILDAVTTGASRDITANTQISEDGRRITGTVRSLRGGIRNGQLELQYLNPSYLSERGSLKATHYQSDLTDIFKGVPVFPLLTGTYSTGNGLIQTIQIELTKRSVLTRPSLIPMEGYEARGRVIGRDPYLHSPDPTILRAISSFADLHYNFYRGELEFAKLPVLGKCRRTPTALSCDGITFHAVAEEKRLLDILATEHCSATLIPFPQEEGQYGPPVTSSTLVEQLTNAEYEGFLHLEERGVVRPFVMGINVTGPPIPGDPTIRNRIISFLPRVHEASSTSQKTSHFLPLDLQPLPLKGNVPQRIVLYGESFDTLEIVRWTHNEIAGVYYSAAFGRVGTFFASRNRTATMVPWSAPLSGTLLGEIERTGTSRNQWIQHQLELQWVTNPSTFPGPYSLGGTFSILWDTVDSVANRNLLASFPLENVRYDPFTGVLGADMNFVPDLSNYSLLAKLESDQIQLAFNNNSPTTEPKHRYHRPIKLRSDHKYGDLSPPEETHLPPNRIHVFLPFDATLVVNGVPIRQVHGTNHRQFAIPTSLPLDKEVTYQFVIKPVVGRVVTHRLTFKPRTYREKPLIVNFYNLQ